MCNWSRFAFMVKIRPDCLPCHLHTLFQPEPVQGLACHHPSRHEFLGTECALLLVGGCWFQWKQRLSRSPAGWLHPDTEFYHTLHPCIHGTSKQVQTNTWFKRKSINVLSVTKINISNNRERWNNCGTSVFPSLKHLHKLTKSLIQPKGEDLWNN